MVKIDENYETFRPFHFNFPMKLQSEILYVKVGSTDTFSDIFYFY